MYDIFVSSSFIVCLQLLADHNESAWQVVVQGLQKSCGLGGFGTAGKTAFEVGRSAGKAGATVISEASNTATAAQATVFATKATGFGKSKLFYSRSRLYYVTSAYI